MSGEAPFENGVRLARSVGATRPRAFGKFVYAGDKLYVRGVTYGTFAPDANGSDYPPAATVEHDFEAMVAAGINTVRTYTVPPGWLLDLAAERGLHVFVGLPWEQHVVFLEDRRRARSIEQRVRAGVRACAGHPAVLCYAVGNEIPAPIVRWHGRRRIERFLERLYEAAKDEDAEALVTYVNYPSTEYLRLPFLDLVCFNVFLEDEERLAAYVARLQTLAGDRPLLLTELGLDARTHGASAQTAALGWQIRSAFRGGCAGAVVFSWTDEWHRGGHDIADWEFGLTDRERRPKPALAAVREAFAEVPLRTEQDSPRVSVVVCSHNGEATLTECLEGLRRLEYPDYEVIVVDDGSTDATAAIAERFDVRLIRTANGGLSAARNTGLAAATGEIVAYLDDDCSPDPHWLTYATASLRDSSFAGVGGPNVPPPDGPVADAIAQAPGGPIHVLRSDREAEHIPGCNMAFRKDALIEVDGFDPQFRIAGDDVDLCWRLHERGHKLAFSPAALVWHRRRGSVRAYLKQQREYGKAEALLERKWPARYNRSGHLAWSGRVYGGPPIAAWHRRARVRYGRWGARLFQSLEERPLPLLASLPLMPEWYLVVLALAAVSTLGVVWPPLYAGFALTALALAALVAPAVRAGACARFATAPSSYTQRLALRALTGALFVAQPFARLVGRLRHGLTPWRRRSAGGLAFPRPRITALWSETWQAAEERLAALERRLVAAAGAVKAGGEYDRWDIEVRGGPLGAVRLLLALEEHGAGKQLARFRSWPRWSRTGLAAIALALALATAATLDGAWIAATVFAAAAAALAARALVDTATATAHALAALTEAEPHEGLAAALHREVRLRAGAPVRAAEEAETR